MNQITLNFDLDTICEPAFTGIRRGYVFAGLGLNAADDPRLSGFHLPGKGQIRFAPDAPTPEVTTQYKKDFSVWIVANALRETTEAFGISLDRLFQACLIANDTANRQVKAHTGTLRDFQRAGVDGKLRRFFDNFIIKTDLADEFQSLTKARNGLTIDEVWLA